LVDLMLCHHESAHYVWHWVHRRPIHSVQVTGAGGAFRAVKGSGNHVPADAGDIDGMLADSDRKTRRAWVG
jgi:hypothetical protein